MIAAYAWAFYLCFALSISVYRLWLKGVLNLWNKLAFAPVLIPFYLTDIVLNYTVLMVMGLPPRNCHTISDRLEFYNLKHDDWRHDVAAFVCDKLLSPLDPAGRHC